MEEDKSLFIVMNQEVAIVDEQEDGGGGGLGKAHWGAHKSF